MNATEKNLNKQSTSILSDSSISTTTVELGNLELNLEPFSSIAKKLVEAGWDGDEDGLEFSGTKKDPRYKYQACTFPQKDLKDIRSVVLRQLGKTSGDVPTSSDNSPLRNSPAFNLNLSVTAGSSSSSIVSAAVVQPGFDLSIPKNTYENALELLRSHLLGLQNPYLAKDIGDKLQNIGEITWGIERKFIEEIVSPSWPFETREYFVTYLHLFREKALNSDLNAVNQTVQKMKEDLQQIILEVIVLKNANLKEYDNWEDFKTLFEIPTFANLDNNSFIKIKRCIDQQAPFALREMVTTLDQLKALDMKAAERHLQTNNYGEGDYGDECLNTLLGEVANRKQTSNEGIVTYWNQPKEFFIGKTLYLNIYNGTGRSSLIINCEKKSDTSLLFYLEDNSEIEIKAKTFETTLVKNEIYHHLIASIQTHVLKLGDLFTICQQGESNGNNVIPLNEYRLCDLKEEVGGWFSNIFCNPYSEYLFVSTTSAQIKYRIQAESQNGQIIKINVEKWNPQKEKYGNKKEMSLSSFERCHVALIKKSERINEIHKENVEKCILVKNEPNEDRARRQHLEQINKDLTNLRLKLLAHENEGLLISLLHNLVKNKIQGIDINILESNSELANFVKEISRKYYDNLKVNRLPVNILLETVLEANYVKHVPIKDNILIARTMELLREAKTHINKIDKNDIILFMGNTGSGKSTSIAYLMKAPLGIKQNHVGEEVLHIQKDEADFPKIGQSIGTSETIYTQGYVIPEKSYLLGDCPGFNDTRGGDYELCTNFSIDQAVQKSKNLLSIVIVLPVSAFLIDKGNPVIDLISSVRERFPFTFDYTDQAKSINNAHVHLLLTKQGQSKEDAVKFMKNGRRFEELVKETTDQIRGLIEKGSSPLSFEVQSFERRQRIWKAVLKMQENDQVHFIDIKNMKERKTLLETFAKQGDALDKKQYLSAMASEHMHKKFGDSVQMAANAWITLIFGQYLQILPDAIEQSQNELTKSERQLLDRENEKKERLERVTTLTNTLVTLQALIQRLNANSVELQDEELRKELLGAVATSTNHLVKEQEEALIQVNKKLEDDNVKLISIKNEIIQLTRDINTATNQIACFQEEVTLLETGDETCNLYKWSIMPTDNLVLSTIVDGAFERAHAAVEELKKEDIIDKTDEGLAQKYIGKTQNLATIKREFRLVPKDQNERNQFLDSGLGGGYVAKVDGLRYKIIGGRTATADGKKVSYQYELDWNGTPAVPYITIDHTVPKREFNYAQIAGIISKINLVETRLISRNTALNGRDNVPGAKSEEIKINKEILDLRTQKQAHEKRIEELETEQAKMEVAKMLEETTSRLNAVNAEKTQLEDCSVIDQRIEEAKQNKSWLEQQIARQRLEWRDVAIIIKTQWESAKLLREFADLVCSNSNEKITEGQHLNATIKTCQEFIVLFDQHKDTLLQKIKEEHGF